MRHFRLSGVGKTVQRKPPRRRRHGAGVVVKSESQKVINNTNKRGEKKSANSTALSRLRGEGRTPTAMVGTFKKDDRNGLRGGLLKRKERGRKKGKRI